MNGAEPVAGFRLSPQQERLWRLQRSAGGASFRARCAVAIEGPLDGAALERALREMVERHEILRTEVRPLTGTAVQVIQPRGEIELGRVSVPEGAGDCSAWIEGGDSGARLSARLIGASPTRHLLVLDLPALMMDTRGFDNLVHELALAYSGGNGGLPEPLQYADLAEWQNHLLESGDTAAGRAYWIARQAAHLVHLALPGQRDTAAAYHPAALRRAASPELARDLEATAADLGRSPRALLLACWHVLLWRLGQWPEQVVGVAFDGRRHPELAGALGLLTRVLPVRCRIAPTDRLADVAERIEGELEQLAVWQEYFRWHDVLGQPGATEEPFLPFGFQDHELARHGAGTVELVLERLEAACERFTLELIASRGHGRLTLELRHDDARIGRQQAERLLDRFLALLASAVGAPTAGAGELEILAASEVRELLVTVNAAEPPAPIEHSLDRLVGAQAAATPERTAVIFGGRRLTYGNLDRLATRLARRLRQAGAAPDAPVGVLAERSLEMVIGLLGVLRSGAAYLPLDPALPADRLAAMMTDARAHLLLTQGGADLPAFAGRRLAVESTLTGEEPPGPFFEGSTGAALDQLAYVIYTSGSTGRPKGIMVSHRAIVNRLTWMRRRFPLAASDLVLQKTPFSFDASIWELFAPLIAGAGLVLARPGGQRDPSYLTDLAASERVSVLQLVPSLLGPFLEEPGLPACSSLRQVFAGGEALPAAVESRFFGRLDASLCNLYGPTETAIDATFWPCDGRTEGAVTPIGRPIQNVRIHVLEPGLRPAPIGVAGELYVGGPGLARGYLGDPALTAAAFVPDPFGPPGSRLYRTGDRARLRADLAAEFLGRVDRQLKLRGFRVEPAEIEQALCAQPGILQAVVAAREDTPGHLLLAAYVVARHGSAVDPTRLREALRRALPEHLVPAAIVLLRELPRLPNGKLDRSALPVPARDERTGRHAPGTQIEETLAALWCELLGLSAVGRDDELFALGGHSILVTQLATRIRQSFRVDLRLRELFDLPRLRQQAERIGELLRSAAVPPLAPIVRAPRDQPLPLSFAQQRLWFLDRLEPSSPVYNLPLAVRLEGALEPAVLMRVLREIVRRHEVLRTHFAERDGTPVQVIAPAVEHALPVIDLSALRPPARESTATALAAAAAGRPFDLARGPLLRALLLHLGAADHVILLTLHHIAGDGWSTGILVRELAALYPACRDRLPSPLPELPIQYADYAVWQRQQLSGDRLTAQIAFWQRRLAGAPHSLALPADHPRPPVQSLRGARVPLSLGHTCTERVRSLCRQEAATPFMVLLAAFDALLYRHTGQRDLLVGTPVANRADMAVEPLIGYFANTLVLRTELPASHIFGDLLRAVREASLAAAAHQDLPFERLVEELRPERDLARSPIFQVMLVLENLPSATLEVEGLIVRPLIGRGGTAKFDLELLLWEDRAAGYQGFLEYSSDLFDQPTIARLAGHFATLLAAAAAAPAGHLSDLPMLSGAERWQLLGEWNDTDAGGPAARLAGDLFAAQVVRRPDAVAARCGERTLTYGELAHRADRLARSLARRGAGPEAVVALLLDRDLDLPIAILAAFGSGAAYLPLDAEYPPARQRMVLERSRAALVLGTRRLLAPLAGALAGLPPGSRPRLVAIEDLADEDAPGVSPAGAGPGGLAYLIFTSGSTGAPKAAMLVHRGMLNHLLAKVHDLGLTVRDRVAQTASQCFDVSVWQLLGPLLAGGQVEILDDEVARQPPRLADAIAARAVTVLETVPSLLRLLIDEIAARGELRPRLPALRWLISTGEALPADLCDAWAALYPAIPMLNAYGPTECSDDVTHHPVHGPAPFPAPAVPIGRPLANTRLYVVDPDWQLAAAGVSGELWVGGSGVGRGYSHDPARTAPAFVPDPFSGAAGERLYRTGDRARRRPDGVVEFLGRLDHQVKLRGFRIELGEIEAALARHPALRAAAVTVREDTPGDPRLVAYLVGDDACPVDVAAIRERLRRELPAWMVPSTFAVLAALPLTPAGKLDRRSLPAPDPPEARAPAPRRSGTEDLLACIWEDLLHVASAGPDDDFFDLGGHSLLATRLVSRIRESFGIELPVREVFAEPRLAALAGRIERARLAGQAPRPPLRRVRRDGDLPLSFAQQRLWFLDQLEPANPAYNIPLALRLTGPLRQPALARALEEIAARHEVLRTAFPTRDGRPAVIIRDALDARLPVIDLAGLPAAAAERELERRAVDEAQAPFQLAVPPLWRTTLLRLGIDDNTLLITLHHIIGDGWSLQVLLRELAALYVAFAAGGPSPLPGLPIAYADYASWQREVLAGQAWEDHLGYWRQRLAGLSTLDLPLDRPRSAKPDARGATIAAVLADDTERALRQLCRREGATLFMASLAALALLLHRITGQQDIAIGTDVANRSIAETEPLIGLFVNHLVLRIDLSGRPRFRDLLRQVRETALDAYARQDMPFDRLVSELRPERRPGATPLFQVLFVFNPPTDLVSGIPGLGLRQLAAAEPLAKYDLTLFADERSQGGLTFTWRYRRSLFDHVTVRQLAERFAIVLAAVAADPQARPAQIEIMTAAEKREQAMQQENLQSSSLQKLKGLQPKAVSIPQGDLVQASPLRANEEFPLLIQPACADVDLVGWARGHRGLVEERLARHGAILFRGFAVPTVSVFEQFAASVCPDLFSEYGDLPREKTAAKVYHSTPYPADQTILFHNESAHLRQWPMKQFFHCVTAARERGETPIVDCREVYRRLSPAIVERFRAKKLLYVRNFLQGVDVPWQEFFRTADRAAVTAWCRRTGIELEWKGADDLMTHSVSPGVCRHPRTGAWTFFNQVQLHHISCLDAAVRESLLLLFGPRDLPRNVYYGDGSPIEDGVMQEIDEVYWSAAVVTPWQEGDVLVLDNMLTAHARNPYVGPRKIVVAMGELITADAVPHD